MQSLSKKILIVDPSFELGVVGPAKFTGIIKRNWPDETDVLTENSKNPQIISVNYRLNYFKRKLTQFFNRDIYHKKIIELISRDDIYSHIIFNNGIIGFGFKIPAGKKIKVVHMINHEKYAILKPYFSLRYLAELFYVWIEKKVIKNEENLIVNSQYLKSKLIQDFGILHEKVFILKKSIEIQKYKFNSDRFQQDIIRVLFVKNNWERGGLEDVAKALRLLTEFRFEISVIGPGIKEKTKIETLFLDAGHIKLNFEGYQSEEEVIKAINSHDLFCVPSRSEALGVAIMEGLASGIAVVTTNVGGIGEVTKNGEFVWVSEPQNARNLADVISNCIQLETERKSKSISGRNYINDNFNHNRMLKDLRDYLLLS